jgi:hypothetical protein
MAQTAFDVANAQKQNLSSLVLLSNKQIPRRLNMANKWDERKKAQEDEYFVKQERELLAKLKAKQEVKNVLPAAVKPAGRKWVAAAAVLLLPVIALAVTEFAGVTHLFRTQQPTPNPIDPGGDPTPNQVASVAAYWSEETAGMNRPPPTSSAPPICSTG